MWRTTSTRRMCPRRSMRSFRTYTYLRSHRNSSTLISCAHSSLSSHYWRRLALRSWIFSSISSQISRRNCLELAMISRNLLLSSSVSACCSLSLHRLMSKRCNKSRRLLHRSWIRLLTRTRLTSLASCCRFMRLSSKILAMLPRIPTRLSLNHSLTLRIGSLIMFRSSQHISSTSLLMFRRSHLSSLTTRNSFKA